MNRIEQALTINQLIDELFGIEMLTGHKTGRDLYKMDSLRKEMNELKEQIDRLQSSGCSACEGGCDKCDVEIKIDIADENMLTEDEQKKIHENFDALSAAAAPLVDYLKKNYDMHTTITVEWDAVKVRQDQISIPVEVDG